MAGAREDLGPDSAAGALRERAHEPLEVLIRRVAAGSRVAPGERVPAIRVARAGRGELLVAAPSAGRAENGPTELPGGAGSVHVRLADILHRRVTAGAQVEDAPARRDKALAGRTVSVQMAVSIHRTGLGRRRANSGAHGPQHVTCPCHRPRLRHHPHVDHLDDQANLVVVVQILALVALEGEERHRVPTNPVGHTRIARLEPTGCDGLVRVDDLARLPVVDLEHAVVGVPVAVEVGSPPGALRADHAAVLGALSGPEGNELPPGLAAHDEVFGGLGVHCRALPDDERARVCVVNLEHPIGGVPIAVQILVPLRGLGRDEGHDRPGYIHGVRGLPHVGPGGPTRGGHRIDLHDGVAGVAVAVEVRVALAGLRDEGGEPAVGESDGRRSPSEVLRLARAGPQVHDVVRRVAVAVQVDAARLPGRARCLGAQEGGLPIKHGRCIGGPEGQIAVAGEVGGAIGRIEPADEDIAADEGRGGAVEHDEAAIRRDDAA